MGECQTICTSDAFVSKERGHPDRMEQSTAIEYDGRKFIISDKISFENQATFTKVEQAARAFCQSTLVIIQKTTYPLSTSPSSAA